MGAVVPIVMGASAIWGAINSANNQKAQAAAAGSASQNQGQALAQAEDLARQQAQGPYLDDLIKAEGSGVKTFESMAGGVPNLGAMIEELFGNNVETGLRASLSQRNANLSGASSTLLGVGGQYGDTARTASQPSASPNPFTGLFSAINQFGKSGSSSGTGVATGLGAGGPGFTDATFAFPDSAAKKQQSTAPPNHVGPWGD